MYADRPIPPVGLRLAASLTLGLAFLGLVPSAWATAQTTAEDAGKTASLDLSRLPRVDGAQQPASARSASLRYEAKSGIQPAYEFLRKALAERGWTELPGGFKSDEYASATFAHGKSRLSMSVMPAGEPGQVVIGLNQHGDIELATLPTPKGAKTLFEGPVSLMRVVDAMPDAVAKEIYPQLEASGWQPYGQAGDVRFFRKGPVRLSARVTTGPAQEGKTIVDYQCELMSAEIPAPPDTLRCDYADTTTELSFDTKSSLDDVVAFYRKELAPAGWKSTTDSPIRDDFEHFLIFRNLAGDMLTLTTRQVDDLLRVRARHQSAAEVAELDRLAKEAAMKKLKARPSAKPTVAIALPAGAASVEAQPSSIEFQLPAGQSRAAIDSIRKALTRAGWKETVAVLDPMAGSVSLEKDHASLSLTYVDTGIMPAEISITAIGVELESPTK